jgi:molybdenum cofactor guanylyltransferase
MKPLFRLLDLRKDFDGQILLNIPELEIRAESCLLLSGRNGAGKSTLLKILAGLEAPDHLNIARSGKAGTLPWRQMRRWLQREVIYLHQQPYMFDRSVAGNIAFGLERAGMPKQGIRKLVDESLDWAGLRHLADKNGRLLSGGEKQRVALTRARVLSPKLLLLDEPFASMDLESRQQTLFFIRRLKTEGISTIVTTHEPYVARMLGDQHLHLCKTGPCRYSLVKPFLYEPASTGTASGEPRGPASMNQPIPIDQASGHQQTPKEEITGVVLAGGMGRRMGGRDKGLLKIQQRPLVGHVLDTLRPQVGPLLINANRNLDEYREFGLPVVQDLVGEFFGPLVGMASALKAAQTPYVLTVPCDSPRLPQDLCQRLFQVMIEADAELSVAHDGRRMQPVFALLRRELFDDMLNYLEHGGRKIDTWYMEHSFALADFSDCPEAFLNINTPEEWEALDKPDSSS